jgi:competence protein ComEA
MMKSFFNFTKKERNASLYFLLFMLLIAGGRFMLNEDDRFLMGNSINKSKNNLVPLSGNVMISEVSKKDQSNIFKGVQRDFTHGSQVSENSSSSAKNLSVNQNNKINADHHSKNTWGKENSRKNFAQASMKSTRVIVKDYFDPNTLSSGDWQFFGLSEKQAISVVNFIKSCGGLTNKEELLKVYVLNPADKQILMKWCKIKKGDLNRWTAEDFTKIKGIGGVLSKRIVKYRSNLGGFYSADQLSEVYGLDSVVIFKIKSRTEVLNFDRYLVNQLSYGNLINHPYVGAREAKKIIEKRSMSPLRSNEELVDVFKDDSELRKLMPYLSYE